MTLGYKVNMNAYANSMTVTRYVTVTGYHSEKAASSSNSTGRNSNSNQDMARTLPIRKPENSEKNTAKQGQKKRVTTSLREGNKRQSKNLIRTGKKRF